jgi:enoyl-CoA hydratase/carnithine racemase
MSPLETLGFALGTSFASGLNLLTGEMLTALQKEFDQLRNDPRVRVVVVAATGVG